MQFSLKRDAKRIALVVLGSILYAFNVKTFIDPVGMYPGGFGGLSLLLQAIFEKFLNLQVPYSVFNLLLNSVPVVISFKFIGKKFTLLSCLAVVLMSVLVDLMPGMDIGTTDPLLLSIFGGLLGGVGISLCLLAEATSGGMDFVSIYLSERHGKDSFNLTMGLNVIILAIAGMLFGWEKALYSIIFQFVCTQVLHALYKRYQQNTLFIITDHPDMVCKVISDIAHHGATIFKGFGPYEQKERSMVYSVVAADEVSKVVTGVHAVDPKAFVNTLKTESLAGRFYRKPND